MRIRDRGRVVDDCERDTTSRFSPGRVVPPARGRGRAAAQVCEEFGLEVTCIDVDEAAARDPELRAEYGDRLPVVLLDGREHSYWEVDEERLRADLRK